MQLETLKTEQRTALGKGVARKLRNDGRIPAICYGRKKDPVALTIDPRDILQQLKGPYGRNAIFNIDVDGESRMVLLKEFQIHPVKRRLLHVDLLEITAQTRLTFTVPIKIVGKSAGEKVGGKLHWVLKEVAVACDPDHLPKVIEVDVTPLKAGRVFYVENLTLPEGVEAVTKPRVPIVSVQVGRGAEEEEGAEGAEETAEA